MFILMVNFKKQKCVKFETYNGCVKFLKNLKLSIVVQGLRTPPLLKDDRARRPRTTMDNEGLAQKLYTHLKIWCNST